MSGEEQIQDLIMGKSNAFFTTRERVISTQLSPDPNWFFLSSCIYWKLKWLSWLVVTSLILPDSLRDRKNRVCKDRWAETKELFLRLFLNFLSRSFSGLRDWVVQTFNVLSAKDICREREREGGRKLAAIFKTRGFSREKPIERVSSRLLLLPLSLLAPTNCAGMTETSQLGLSSLENSTDQNVKTNLG